ASHRFESVGELNRSHQHQFGHALLTRIPGWAIKKPISATKVARQDRQRCGIPRVSFCRYPLVTDASMNKLDEGNFCCGSCMARWTESPPRPTLQTPARSSPIVKERPGIPRKRDRC